MEIPDSFSDNGYHPDRTCAHRPAEIPLKNFTNREFTR
jgi:hypothetical protein